MAIKLNKPVYRVTYENIKDRSKRRAIVAGMEPGDVFSMRMQGTRQLVTVPIVDVFWYAMRERQAARKAKRASNKLEQLNGHIGRNAPPAHWQQCAVGALMPDRSKAHE